MRQLNFHHLYYFWSVAKEGHLTRAARKLHVSQSALSSQIHQLQDQLGQELFTRDGCGSLIHRDSYESIRTADIDDVAGILALIQPLEEEGVLVRRSRELLENEIHRFTVIERDGMVISCAALYPFTEEGTAEIACVATHPDYRGGGRGERVLAHLEKQARQLSLGRLFVLTTRTAHWFMEQGYAPGSTQDLPQARQRLYNYRRNSQIFCKSL